ncbi:MFS transporter [Actinomadura kijaniata]|uniref:MFS transporter n=1 Tax=Actinomadura kijaniata TaxID=46161 RepID=UPI00082B0459|nr:MFS transporter [Actinomadura kijaniata]
MERHPRRWLILVVLCLSTLILVIDNNVLMVAIPALTRDLGATARDIQWITDAYILVAAGLLLTAGSLADRFGRRRVMVVGLAAFGAASLAAAYADSPAQLIAARALMGVGSALVLPSTLSILITVFDEEERRKATSAWSAAAVTGLIGGPILGGAMVTHLHWGSVFLINVPVVVVAIAAAYLLMPESRAPARRFDPLGAVLSLVGMVALVWAIIELPQRGLGDPATLSGLAVAAVVLTAFVLWERRVTEPMVPLALFRNRDFTGGSLSLVLVQIGNGGLVLVITQYLQFVLGFTPTRAGLAMVPLALAVIVTNGVGAALGQRVGNRVLTAAGLGVLAGGFLLMSTLRADDGFATVTATLVVFGIGAGLAQPAAIAALMGAVPARYAGVGSALNDTLQQAGAALGVAVLGSLLTGVFTGAMPGSAPEVARRSIGEALAVAERTGDEALAASARQAFTDGLAVTCSVSACAVLGAAVLAFVLIRGRGAGRTAPVEEQTPVTTS